MTAKQLEARLGVSHATLYRDLKVLLESPLPIVKACVNGETRYSIDTSAWPKLPASAPFVLALSIARGLLHPLDGTSINRHLDKFLRAACAQATDAAIDVPATGPRHHPSFVEAIEAAIRDGRRCRLRYRSVREQTPRWRVVEPVAMRVHDEALYVAAWDVDGAGWRVFKAARIDDVEPDGTAATAHPPYDATEVFASSAGIWSGEIVDVAVRVDAEKARFLREYPLVEDQELVPQGDGSVVVRARVAGIVEPMAWVMGWGRHAEVLEPAALRSAITRELDDAAARYHVRSSHES